MANPRSPARKKRETTTPLPWQDPKVRSDLDVQLNTRQPERLMLKVEYVAAMMRITKKDLVERALGEFADKELKKRNIPT